MQRIYTLICLFIFGISPSFLAAQEAAQLFGKITDAQGQAVEAAQVQIVALHTGASSDAEGAYRLEQLPAGAHRVRVYALGYRTQEIDLLLEAGANLAQNFVLQADALQLDQVVVTGTRSEVSLYDAPVVVSRIGQRNFEATQAISLAEGLNFAPGLRLETNCQNCGFTQVRMNGLSGAYSQILINSRPVFSALAGVYGLEMLPVSMIDRVEIVRGGGSALYGGNAIAGTINIITKDPQESSFSVGLNQYLIYGRTSERALSANGTIVSEALDKGISLYAQHRSRDFWDANGDSLSELTRLNSLTFGGDAFWRWNMFQRLQVGFYNMHETRRGGSMTDLPPHQSPIAEALQHDIAGANASYEHYSKDYRHKFSAYTAQQWIRRSSYYGAGGSVLQAGDTLTEAQLLAQNAYGQSRDWSSIAGAQYALTLNDVWTFTLGTEYQYNQVRDEMAGYSRFTQQRVGAWGTYAQAMWKPIEKLTFLAGGRFDAVQIRGNYGFGGDTLGNRRSLYVPVPRLSAMYDIVPTLKLRISFAQGYRAPQAFDEDLHLETIGGAARYIRLSSDLQTERSNSYTASLNFAPDWRNLQASFLVEAFRTDLRNPFILADPVELPNGVSMLTKRNGAGATVQGVHLEANMAQGHWWILQAGITLQSARYRQAEIIWTPSSEPTIGQDTVRTSRMLRTPDVYGFWNFTFTPSPRWLFAYSGVFTGKMNVPQVVDTQTEYTVLRRTPVFWEHHLKAAYTLRLSRDGEYSLQLSAGVQNLLHSYQRDLPTGLERDASYIYGASRPRTFFVGCKLQF